MGVKLGFVRVPNAEIGSAIVDHERSGGTEEVVIRLALDFRNERHCVVLEAEGRGGGFCRGSRV